MTLAQAELHTESSAGLSDHRVTTRQQPQPPHIHPALPSTQSSRSDAIPVSPPPVPSLNRDLAMGSTASTAQISAQVSPPPSGFQNAIEGWIKSRRDPDELSAAFERNQVGFAAEGLLVQGNAESRIVHALNIIATITSDLH